MRWKRRRHRRLARKKRRQETILEAYFKSSLPSFISIMDDVVALLMDTGNRLELLDGSVQALTAEYAAEKIHDS